MNVSEMPGSSRREFLGNTGRAVAASALAGWPSRRCMPVRTIRSSLPWLAAGGVAPVPRSCAGTKGSAVISTNMHTPAKCRIYKGHNFVKSDLVWAFPQPEPNPYQLEWDHLIDAIRQDRPFNEAKRVPEASLVQIMGRTASHTGQVVTWDQALNHDHEFASGLDILTMNSGPEPWACRPEAARRSVE